MNKLVDLVPDVLKFFSKPKFNEKDRRTLARFGGILGHCLVNSGKDPALFLKAIRELDLKLGQKIDHLADSEDQINNTFGLGAFYWIISPAISNVLAESKEEEDRLFMIQHGLEYNLRPVLENIGQYYPFLDDLRKNMADNNKLTAKLAADKRTIDDEIYFLLKVSILEKYKKGKSNISLALRGDILLEKLAWIEDFKGSHADLISELIRRQALRSDGL